MFTFSSSPSSSQQGFTLVELMISIGIITLITSLVMIRHSSFNSAVLEENQAYEVAFDIRQTQMRAVSPQVGTGDIRGGYGIRFLDGNRTYEIYQQQGGSDLVVDRRQLDNRFHMEITGAGTANTIFFQRPDFDARFLNNEGNPVSGVDSMTINISMTDDEGIDTGGRDIIVTSSGQISIRRAGDE